MNRRHLPWVLGVCSAMLVLVCFAFVDYRAAGEAQEKRIDAWLQDQGQELENVLRSRLNLVWGLGAFVQMNPRFTNEEFSRFAEALEKRWDGIRSLQLAPDGVVTYLTKPELNARARGHDLLGDPARRSTVIRAIENREYIIAGPFELKQGGTAIVGRMPVYLPRAAPEGERFWGFATILLDVGALFASSGLNIEHAELDFAVRGRDGLGEEGDVFYGHASVFDGPHQKAKVTLPTGCWILAARAKSAWPGAWEDRTRLWLIGFALAAAVGLIMSGLLWWPQRLSAEVRKATRALAASRQQYRQLAHIAPTGIYHADAEGDVIYANERFREIVGTQAQNITSDCWNNMIHPDDLEFANEEWDAAVISGVSRCEYRFLHEDGTVVWVLDQAMKVEEDEAGHVSAFIGTLTDITQLKNIETALEEARREADAASEAKSEFLASISHEIRTPLNGILGMVRVLQRTAPSDEVRSRLGIVEASADTLVELLSEVLDFSQIQAGQVEITSEPFRLDELVGELTTLWQPRAQEKGLQIVADLDGCPDGARLGDVKRLRQVLSNLISNAIKFTADGTVTVTAGEPDDARASGLIEVSVADTGIGISAEDQRVIFDKFTQADSSASRRYDGTGLGLAICKQLSELMGGSISVESVPGEGAVFRVNLPCPRTDELPAPLEVEPAAEDVPTGQLTVQVLLAEDNFINQHVITAMLERSCYEIDVVENGREAVEQVQAKSYDVVLMDIRMPELDGVGATRAIRELPGDAANIAIIALTANSLESERKAYLAAGMNDCLTKPIDLHELLEKLASYTARSDEDCGRRGGAEAG